MGILNDVYDDLHTWSDEDLTDHIIEINNDHLAGWLTAEERSVIIDLITTEIKRRQDDKAFDHAMDIV